MPHTQSKRVQSTHARYLNSMITNTILVFAVVTLIILTAMD